LRERRDRHCERHDDGEGNESSSERFEHEHSG
jgi:hypothetical protein